MRNLTMFGSKPKLDVEQLKEKHDRGEVLLLDVREHDELRIASLPGALHIPMHQVPTRLGELPRDRPIACLCHHGARSAQVQGFLMKQGFAEVYNVAGGINAWSQRIDPSVPKY
jgi:rhodanese-related sulfurtransferase